MVGMLEVGGFVVRALEGWEGNEMCSDLEISCRLVDHGFRNVLADCIW